MLTIIVLFNRSLYTDKRCSEEHFSVVPMVRKSSFLKSLISFAAAILPIFRRMGSFRHPNYSAYTILGVQSYYSGEPDSINGVTSSGVSGIGTVTIEVTNFNGDGSFPWTEGN